MKRFYQNEVILAFLSWRIGLFAAAFLAVWLIPQFGGRFPYANNQLMNTGLPPWIWGFGNFDGVHFLRLVQMGYEGSKFSQAFFPLYPLFLKLTALGNYYLVSALVFTNLVFLAALAVLYKLFSLDFDRRITLKALGLLLAFPTAFYFGAVYSESLFLLLTSATLLLARKKYFLLAGLTAAMASATRVVGLFLVPFLLIEIWLHLRASRRSVRNLLPAGLGLIMAPLGTLLYMLYLKINFANPLYFLSAQPEFGAQRSENLILLPQVLFRYLKMILSIPFSSLTFFNISLELLFTIIPLTLVLLAYKKIRFSYWIFMLGCLLLPTLTGTLSSMPRYSLTTFLLLPLLVTWIGKYYKYTLIILIIFQAILLGLFVRGYWVA